eukprot:302588_1
MQSSSISMATNSMHRTNDVDAWTLDAGAMDVIITGDALEHAIETHFDGYSTLEDVLFHRHCVSIFCTHYSCLMHNVKSTQPRATTLPLRTAFNTCTRYWALLCNCLIICFEWILSLFKYISKQPQTLITALTIVCMVQTTNAAPCGVTLSRHYERTGTNSDWSSLNIGVYFETGMLNDEPYYTQSSWWEPRYLYYFSDHARWYVSTTLGSSAVYRYCEGSDLLTCAWYDWDASVSSFVLDGNATVSTWECPTSTSDLYILVLEPKTWDEAEDYCQTTYNSHLATITDDVSAQALLDLCPRCDLWMGLNDHKIEGVWEYVDGTECSGSTGCGTSYKFWNNGEPDNAGSLGNEDCAYIRYYATDINGMLADIACSIVVPFACNKPTPKPTNAPSSTPTNGPTSNPIIAPTSQPTNAPTSNPTIAPTSNPTIAPTSKPTNAPTSEPTIEPTSEPANAPTSTLVPTGAPTHSSVNIAIQNYIHSQERSVAFSLSNIDLSCGGSIAKVEISDHNNYDDIWVTNDPTASIQHYSFIRAGLAFTLPLSVRITAQYNHINHTIESDDVITEFTALQTFDFGSNFCQQNTTVLIEPNTPGNIKPETTVEIGYSHIQYVVISAFVLIGILGFIDARCIRKNDFFHLMFIFLSMLNVLDTLSDVFFAVDVFGTYSLATEHKSHFLMIFIASVSFIIIPVMISLYQLHAASSKHWLKDNKIRQWLVQYVAPLYGVSILTGSSFGATFIFNSNLFDMNIFDMGLNKKYLLSWKTKRVYSILFFENIPQLCLSVWYTFMIGNITFIPAVQMMFSVISIIISTLTFCLQKKIYFTQDFVEITIHVKGQCIIDKLKVCQRRIDGLQQYLSQVFGVHKNAIDIEKPANIPNGVQIRMHIFHNDSVNAAGHFQELLYGVIEKSSLQERIQNEWKLSSAPSIDTGDIETTFFKSKEKKQISIAARQAHAREGVPDDEEAIPFRKTDSMELAQIWTETDHIQ